MDYENLYKEAVSKIKSILADKKKQGLTNCLFEGDLNEIFTELKESEDERIRNELIKLMKQMSNTIVENYTTIEISTFVAWLEKQGEQKSDWSEYDKVVIDAIYNTLKHSNVTKCGVEVTVMLLWLEKLEKQGKPNVEQLTAFAQHLNKRGAFRDDLCMDFEHEAQSFIEMQKFNATQLGV